MVATESPELKTAVRVKFFAVQHHLFDHTAVIRAGKSRDVYAIEEPQEDCPVESRRFRVFHLVKCCRASAAPEFQPYRVVVSSVAGFPSDCSCVGFGRWGACKHVVAMTQFVESGK